MASEENLIAQEDERMALESIYQEEFVEVAANSFNLRVQVDLPEDGVLLRSLVTPSSSQEEDGEDEEVFDVAGQLVVKHLPPLLLSCTQPESYPSDVPPQFSISAEWLDDWQVQLLREELLEQWEEGETVVFAWVEWLRASSVSFLTSTENTCVAESRGGEDGEAGTQEWRGIVLDLRVSDSATSGECAGDKYSGLHAANLLLRSLQKADRQIGWEIFQQEVQECPLCFEEFPGTEFVHMECCGSHYCESCLGTMAELSVKDKSVHRLRCPECAAGLHPTVLKHLLTQEMFELWEETALEKSLQRMGDIRYCPRDGTAAVVDDGLAQCTTCYFNFCSKCLMAYHGDYDCEFVASATLSWQEAMSLAAMAKMGVRCPNCGIFVEKEAGCNKMTCGNCYSYFCYLCGKTISGYDHFWGNEECVLFTGTQPAGRVRRGRRRDRPAVQVNADPTTCPTCKQRNVRFDNNNDILCWSCTSHFCYLCRKVIRGTKHFSKDGCRQHSRAAEPEEAASVTPLTPAVPAAAAVGQ